MALASARLATAFAGSANAVRSPADTETARPTAALASERGRVTVPTPYRTYTPRRRVRHLAAHRNGNSAVYLNGKGGNLALLDGDGRITAVFRVDAAGAAYAAVTADGGVWHQRAVVRDRHPGWGFPTGHEITRELILPGANEARTLPVYAGTTHGLPPGYEAAFPVALDGVTAAFGVPGGLIWGRLGEPDWRRYNDIPLAPNRMAVRQPRFPTAVAFAPDQSAIFCALDTRPRLGGMGRHCEAPMSTRTMLLDVGSGDVLWAFEGGGADDLAHAVHDGFAATANGGSRTAFISFDGRASVISREGDVRFTQQLGTPGDGRDRRQGPIGGIGVAQSDDGGTVAFGLTTQLLLLHGDDAIMISAPALCDLDVAADGGTVFTAFADGRVQALSRTGSRLWQRELAAPAPQLAAISGGLVVATNDGVVHRLGPDGQTVWRADVISRAAADVRAAPTSAAVPQPRRYREPPTLALAKERLGAQRVAAWSGRGPAAMAYDHAFQAFAGETTLTGTDLSEVFAHIVYRRTDTTKALSVRTHGADGTEIFHLDIPTPEYRVVDIPVRGPNASVALVAPEGGVEVAAFSLWAFTWPGPNIAYVTPPSTDGDDGAGDGLELDGDTLTLEESADMSGSMKDCAIFNHNPDPDQVSGPWLRVPVPPLAVVDGKRFGNGSMKPMSEAADSYRGVWWTAAFPSPVQPTLVAVYDRANRQSQLAQTVAAFSGFVADERGHFDRNSGDVLAAAIANDQFWRLLPLAGRPLTQLGVHVYAGDSAAEGISEVEAYEAR
jgi:hypothetical protein